MRLLVLHYGIFKIEKTLLEENYNYNVFQTESNIKFMVNGVFSL